MLTLPKADCDEPIAVQRGHLVMEGWCGLGCSGCECLPSGKDSAITWAGLHCPHAPPGSVPVATTAADAQTETEKARKGWKETEKAKKSKTCCVQYMVLLMVLTYASARALFSYNNQALAVGHFVISRLLSFTFCAYH